MRGKLEEAIRQLADHLRVPMRALILGATEESWAILRGLPLAALLQKAAHDQAQVCYLRCVLSFMGD
ncbi:hypothetical protein Pint_23137 [Pistacia integerrima]|uniref:Uncharacterized protein n=1 Tax=Pistacia integerrima TaxID=434235 RepID=A0ACC0YHT2_9ROSI|nr:hypothetical protein Pint_23137 [Pistacia integerrima]